MVWDISSKNFHGSVNNRFSYFTDVPSSMAQFSVIEPVWILIYVNDMSDTYLIVCQTSVMKLFHKNN